MLRFAKSLVQSVTGIASEDFDDWVSARSGDEHAAFFSGGFADALAAAAKPDAAGVCTGGRGLVLAWLHQNDDAVTQLLCSKVWPHPPLVRELRSRFIPWAGDVCRFEAGTLAKALGLQEFPALLVLQTLPRGAADAIEWPRGCFFRVHWLRCGRVDERELVRELSQLGGQLDAERDQRAAWRQQLQQMQEMNSAFARAMGDTQLRAQRQAAEMEALREAEAEERPCFAVLYESSYGHEPPNCFEGSFEEALACARSERRLLLVWLFDDGAESDSLSQAVLSGEVFGAFVAEYFVMWPGNAERWLFPKQLYQHLRLESLPSLLVLQPMSVFEAEILPWGDPRAGAPVEFPANSAWALLGCWSGAPDEEAVVAFLSEHGERAAELERRREEARQRSREQAAAMRALRDEQDREFQESLARDLQLSSSAPAPPSGSGQPTQEGTAVAREREARELAASEAQRKSDELAARRRGVAEKLLAVEAPTVGLCKLVLRMPSGCRAEGTFGAEEPLSVVYDWADCCGELHGFQGGEPFEVPERFTLATTYPRSLLTDRERSLRDLQLVPNAVLAVVADDD